jgi:ATP-dependent RNA helicase DeaD
MCGDEGYVFSLERALLAKSRDTTDPITGPTADPTRKPGRRRRRSRGGRQPEPAGADAEPIAVPEPSPSPPTPAAPQAEPRQPPAKQAAATASDQRPASKRKKKFPGKFAELSLSDQMLAALEAAEYLDPTPVQTGLIPRALAGVDVMAQAQTGTGKTAAFAIPVLEMLDTGEDAPRPQALVLVPTRELAVQVRDEVGKLAEGSEVSVIAVYGGKPIRKQTEQLRDGADIVVGTPGRILDHLSRGTLVLGQLRFVILDEADRMLDIGFRPDIEKILRRCPRQRQTLLLSATIPPPVARLAQQYMHEPESLNFSTKDLAVETIEQFYFTVDPENKFDLLVALLKHEQPRQAIIFCRTKRGTEKVHLRLAKHLQGVTTIHGDLPQKSRDRAMEQFRSGRIRYLVATDVVGRGIDVTSISHIINYDIPQFSDDYVHRVGRAGRMGREGVAYTFVSPEEGNELTRIEVRINRLLQRAELPGFVTFTKPEAVETTDEGAPTPKPPPRPIFGRPQRRIRRAL